MINKFLFTKNNTIGYNEPHHYNLRILRENELEIHQHFGILAKNETNQANALDDFDSTEMAFGEFGFELETKILQLDHVSRDEI